MVKAIEVESKGGSARYDRLWKKKKQLCVTNQCGHIEIVEESYNCVNKCLSPACYNDIYAEEPLEDGEVDNTRSKIFTNCVRKETKTNRGRSST